MGGRITWIGIVTIIRGDQRDSQLPVQVNQALVDHLLLMQSIGLEFEIEPLRTEDGEKFLGGYGRGIDLFVVEEGGNLTAETARQRDQAGTVAVQQGLVDAGFVMEALRVSVADQANQVVVSDGVLDQQDQVIVVTGPRRGRLVQPISPGHVDFAPNDRLHSC